MQAPQSTSARSACGASQIRTLPRAAAGHLGVGPLRLRRSRQARRSRCGRWRGIRLRPWRLAAPTSRAAARGRRRRRVSRNMPPLARRRSPEYGSTAGGTRGNYGMGGDNQELPLLPGQLLCGPSCATGVHRARRRKQRGEVGYPSILLRVSRHLHEACRRSPATCSLPERGATWIQPSPAYGYRSH